MDPLQLNFGDSDPLRLSLASLIDAEAAGDLASRPALSVADKDGERQAEVKSPEAIV